MLHIKANKRVCKITVVFISALLFTSCSVFLVYPDDVMRAFEKIRRLVIMDCYFSGRMETTSTYEQK